MSESDYSYTSDDDNYYYGNNDFDLELDVVEEVNDEDFKDQSKAIDAETITKDDVVEIIESIVESVKCRISGVFTTDQIRHLLFKTKFNDDEVVKKLKDNPENFLVDHKLLPIEEDVRKCKRIKKSDAAFDSVSNNMECLICCSQFDLKEHKKLKSNCKHSFCKICWFNHIKSQVDMNNAANITCMATDCDIVCLPTLVSQITDDNNKASFELYNNYMKTLCNEYIEVHPKMIKCPGTDCLSVIFAENASYKEVKCSKCSKKVCFSCSFQFHAPANCANMIKWKRKCEDDSETSNYIRAHTKECPKCHTTIEKNGGCNHMTCKFCNNEFCYVCLGQWKEHGTSYYNCSKYNDDMRAKTEKNISKAASELKKYLHYFGRWDNHLKSLKLEEELREKIKERINEKINKNEGTWIDWQYLYEAAEVLTKCRFTLMHCYPEAYYFTEDSPEKELFEYQLNMFEKAVEDLSCYTMESYENISYSLTHLIELFTENILWSLFLTSTAIHAVLLISSPIQAVFKWFRRQSSDSDTCIPYIAGIIGSSLWLRYAMFISDFKMVLLQSYAVLMQSFFIISLLIFRSKKKKLLRSVFVVYSTILFYNYYASIIPHDDGKILTGRLASTAQIAGSLVCPYLIYQAITTKVIDFVPMAPVAFTWVMEAHAIIYSIGIDDFYMLLANTIFFCMDGSLLCMFFIFPTEKPPQKTVMN
uniref:RBR-type E3 ubiquitin transferase n=1 Tax=Strongyloides papillosus TaxID=174720 RepID=A0A0N5C3X5_STREA